jgi:hypothetical protein
MIISRHIEKGGTVIIGLKNKELTFDIKKGKKGAIIEASELEEVK